MRGFHNRVLPFMHLAARNVGVVAGFACFFLLSVLSFSDDKKDSLTQPKVTVIEATAVKFPPIVDGIALDSCWAKVPSVKVPILSRDGKTRLDATVKACVSGGMLYLLVRYESGAKHTTHRPWHWDKEKKVYISGEEREESLSVLFHENDDPEKIDIWTWRADRTDPSGFADDMFIERGVLRLDFGRKCWYSGYHGRFAGDLLPRFMNREPSGSAADVKARGHWVGEWLTVEFSRKLDTKHSDDIALSKNLKISILRSKGAGAARKTSSKGKNVPEKRDDE